MQKISMAPYALLAIVLHGMFAIWYYKTAPSPTMQLPGKGGEGLSVALDNNTYKNLLTSQQQKKSQAKASEQKKTVKAKKREKHASKKASVKPKQMPTKTVDRAVVEPKVVKQAIKAIAKPVVRQPVVKAPSQRMAHALAQAKLVKTAMTMVPDNSVSKKTMAKAAAELSDQSNIAQASEQQSVNAQHTAPQANMGATAPLVMDDKTKQYLRKLMRHLQRYKSYPAALKKAHIEGKPVILFSINQQGRITDLNTKRSSGNQALDQAAMAVFRQANPLPAIPVALHRDKLTMSLPIEFNLVD